jgi:hypothetical protein
MSLDVCQGQCDAHPGAFQFLISFYILRRGADRSRRDVDLYAMRLKLLVPLIIDSSESSSIFVINMNLQNAENLAVCTLYQ